MYVSHRPLLPLPYSTLYPLCLPPTLLYYVTNTTSPLLQLKRDLILKGELPPEACCSYGRCLRDVVIAMA